MRDELAIFLHAVSFLSRLPFAMPASAPDDVMRRSLRYYPLAGVVIGLPGGICYLVAAALMPPLLAASLALVVHLLVTGALHEDGLADTVDGLGGAAGRERALAIMRDSRTGAFGALALVLSLLLRIIALAALAPSAGFLAWISVQALGRMAIPPALALARYARDDGLATGLAAGASRRDLGIALASGALIVLLGAGPPGLAAMLGAALAAGILLWRLVVRIGGYTGDGLGAIEQVAEITGLVVLASLAG